MSVHLSNGTVEKIVGLAYDLKLQTVTFKFAAPLPAGTAVLKTDFFAPLSEDLAGLYRSKVTLRGAPRNMAVTQFEATDARRCFPCWDEPAFKAVYKLSITAAADRTVVSNMHVSTMDTSADGAKKTWHFHETPIMSTYLVAAIVGDFDCVSARGKNGVLTTVYTPVGKSASGKFALKVAVDCLEFFEKLFGIPYMGSKSDLLAIADFAAGAMENLGKRVDA